MKPHLDAATLVACLAGELDDAPESRVMEHLDACEECRERLERTAASEGERSRITGALRLEQQAILSGADSRLSSNPSSPQWPSEYALAPIDFAISFLEPSSRDGSLGRLGDFEIDCVIGSGGMGLVLRGFQQELNRPVAIKVMAPHLATSAAARKRFLREAQATAAIVHPNVMPILSVSEKSTLPFLVMPFVACHSLQQRLDAEGPLPIVEVLRIALQVSEALAAAHAQGLVHRDVKPANILLERGVDRALLTDFGLARAVDDASLTRSGVIAGTPQYMSPEQARGDAIDGRSDLFSLGSVIYAMCAGHPPFRAETSYGILQKVISARPRPLREINPRVPDWLQRLVGKLMAPDRDDRYSSAAHVADLLRQCLAQEQQPMSQSIPAELQSPRRNRGMRFILLWTVAAATLISLGLLIAMVSSYTSLRYEIPSTSMPAQPQPQLSISPSNDEPTSRSIPLMSFEYLDGELQSIDKDLQKIESEFSAL